MAKLGQFSTPRTPPQIFIYIGAPWYIEVFLVNTHLLIADTSAGLGGWKKVGRPLWCWRQIRPCTSASLIRSKRGTWTTYVQGIVYIFSPTWSACMRTPFADQLSIIYKSDYCNGPYERNSYICMSSNFFFTLIYCVYEICHVIHVLSKMSWCVQCLKTCIWRRFNVFHCQNVPTVLQYLETFLWFSNFVRTFVCDHRGDWAKDGFDRRLQLLGDFLSPPLSTTHPPL